MLGAKLANHSSSYAEPSLVYTANREPNNNQFNKGKLSTLMLRQLIVTLTLTIFATLCFGERILVGIRSTPNFSHAGILLAQAEGLYGQNNNEVELRQYRTEAELQQAFLNGDIDVALANISLFKRSVEANRGLKLIGIIEQIDDMSFISSQTSNLLGEVAASATYGDPSLYLSTRRVLVQNNLNNRIIYKAESGDHIRSNTLQNYGVLIVDQSTQALRLRQQGFNFWQATSRDFGLPTYGDALFANEALAQNVSALNTFANTTLSAWERAYQQPDKSAKTIANQFELDRSELTSQAQAMRSFVLPDYLPVGNVDATLLSTIFPRGLGIDDEQINSYLLSQSRHQATPSTSWQPLLLPLLILLAAITSLFVWQVRKANKIISKQIRQLTELDVDKESLERLRSVLANSFQGCAHLSISENRMFFDTLSKGVFNISSQTNETTLDNFFDYINPANQDRVRRLFWNGVASNKAFTLVFDEQSPGQTKRINARFVPTSHREQLEYCMLVRDDSESLRQDNDMRQLRMSLDQAMRANETIRSQISRSISSHIEIIHQQIGLIVQSRNQADLEDTIARAMISVDHVKGILRDINLHGSHENRQHARLDVNELLRSLYSRALEKSQSRGISVVLNEPMQEITLLADSPRVRQLLASILDNSLKYTVHGQVTMSVHVSEIQKSMSWIELRIILEDTGIGLNPEQLKQYQSQTGDFSAAVSGIPFLKRQAIQCGASLDAISVEGEGTSVTLTLSAPKIEDDLTLPVKRFTTVIIDMDRPYRRRLMDQLELLGIEVITASNIRDGIDEINVSKPNNVLIAALNSTDASHQLSRLQEHQLDCMPHVSVLIDEAANSNHSLYNLGASSVYTAPLAINVLANIIEQVIQAETRNE